MTGPPPASDLAKRAALAGIAVALFLVALKARAAWATGSAAVLGSLADSALDLLASMATIAGVWIAARPADADHRFGHGKAEALAAVVQAVLMALSAALLAIRAIQQGLAGARTAAAGEGIVVSAVAVAATLALVTYQRRVVARTGSVAIATDRLHYLSDLALNGAVIAALALDQYAGFAHADPLFALGIAAWLAWNAWRASQAASEQLMDREWPEDRKQRFLRVAGEHPLLCGVHDLRTRTSGAHEFAQFHAAVDGRMTVSEAHRVMDEIEATLAREFPGVEVLIHPDPQGLVNERGAAAEELLPQRRRTRAR